jgi:glycosyltransferase involved in cell wall biosynthesis
LNKFKNKCVIIPIGIDSTEFEQNDEFEKKLNQKFKDKKIVLSIGRLVYYKGFNNLILAGKSLPNDTIILIGGKGPLINELQNLINENNLESKVLLLGKIESNQMAAYYKRADIFCLPSNERSEAFGVVLIEAMSFSKPLITCKIEGSGVSWVNQNNNTGFVTEINSPTQIAEAIIKINSDVNLKNHFSTNALKRYQTEFTRYKMIDSLVELYSKNI